MGYLKQLVKFVKMKYLLTRTLPLSIRAFQPRPAQESPIFIGESKIRA